jgi:hypothetical protein
MLQRGGEVVIRMLENVKQVTIGPLIERTIAKGTLIYTDEYDIYSRLVEWGYDHETVCHAAGEYARDDDGDGFCEVHVHWKDSGRCSGVGCDRTEEFPRRACRCTWVSSSSCTTSGLVARGCWGR